VCMCVCVGGGWLGLLVGGAAAVTVTLAPGLTLGFTSNATAVQFEVTNSRGTWCGVRCPFYRRSCS
jgi:hypothetical protein